jgi:poly(beta-D-mannuronate) lyase
MLRIVLCFFYLLCTSTVWAKSILVKNIAELNASKNFTTPGDTIVLQNGVWNNVTIMLDAVGNTKQPITYKAQTSGKVIISGHSTLYIGGQYIIVDGLLFTNGYAGKDAVISFKTNKKQVANYCRVTNTVINDYNNPKRLDENYWIAFYGKNNRLDHCSFLNKKNIGVLLAVILDDAGSRENKHLIDHNYFGVRLPLASNGGEIIRVGVSEHAKYNSFTQITNNLFEYCNGETEIISIKSASNRVANNVFKECQGAVVLRHGNNNVIENNIFLGNDKEGTGGVRIINKGQTVYNNFFYKCRGEGFRSALSIMNGIFNSPENRYHQVLNAVVANNTFYECSTINFCEGTDAERTATPQNVHFFNNLFYTTKDSILYKANDSIDGFIFNNNRVSNSITQVLPQGFGKEFIHLQKLDNMGFPVVNKKNANTLSDSLKKAMQDNGITISEKEIGYHYLANFKRTWMTAISSTGAKWTTGNASIKNVVKTVYCNNATEVLVALNGNSNTIVNLTGKEYLFTSPLSINTNIVFTTTQKEAITFIYTGADTTFFIKLVAGYCFSIQNIKLEITNVATNSFISTDTSGNSNHSTFSLYNCSINGAKQVFFTAAKSSVCDSIMVKQSSFTNCNGSIFKLDSEDDKKGYYNVEKMVIEHTNFTNGNGQLLSLLRTGNDESTMGPKLIFINNKMNNCSTLNNTALISNYGVQYSAIQNNSFINCNKGKILVQYIDIVRARHLCTNNKLVQSGTLSTNKFTVLLDNSLQ